jgi:hypothetical protein
MSGVRSLPRCFWPSSRPRPSFQDARALSRERNRPPKINEWWQMVGRVSSARQLPAGASEVVEGFEGRKDIKVTFQLRLVLRSGAHDGKRGVGPPTEINCQAQSLSAGREPRSSEFGVPTLSGVLGQVTPVAPTHAEKSVVTNAGAS